MLTFGKGAESQQAASKPLRCSHCHSGTALTNLSGMCIRVCKSVSVDIYAVIPIPKCFVFSCNLHAQLIFQGLQGLGTLKNQNVVFLHAWMCNTCVFQTPALKNMQFYFAGVLSAINEQQDIASLFSVCGCKHYLICNVFVYRDASVQCLFSSISTNGTSSPPWSLSLSLVVHDNPQHCLFWENRLRSKLFYCNSLKKYPKNNK